MSTSMRLNKNLVIRLAAQLVNAAPEGSPVDAKGLATQLGMKESAAAKLLTEMADAGDIDRQYPKNEDGKRGRAKAVFSRMTEERKAELAPIIAAREAVAVRLKDFVSSAVTLRRVSLSLADACRLFGIAVPEGLDESPDDDDDDIAA